MPTANDSALWLAAASRHVELAAHQIARFRNQSWTPAWQDLIPKGSSSPDLFSDNSSSHDVSSEGPAWQHDIVPGWGLQRRRSTRVLKKASPVHSPVTPLDVGSGSGSDSTCAGDEDSSLRAGDGAAVTVSGWANENKMAVMEHQPSASRKASCSYNNTASKQIGIKRKIYQLQEEEKLLMEEKNRLQKVMEAERKTYEALKSENSRLKNQQTSMQREKSSVESAAASEAPSSSKCYVLPDLNEPWSENDC